MLDFQVGRRAEETVVRMTNRVLAVVVVAITVGAVITAAPTAEARGAAPVGYAGPARGVISHVATPNSTGHFTSRNWDGYITYTSPPRTDFNFVKATWVQPKVRCEAATAWTVFWVGIDGWYDNTVEQGGSSAYCPTKGGAAQYQLWWEMYPTNAIQTTLTIKAGDTITASVKYVPSSKHFVIVVKDVTTGKSFTKSELCSASVTCNRSSTDVITEDVGHFGAGSYFPLADYGTMRYTGIGVTDTAGHTGSITGSKWVNGAVTEAGGGVTYATVSALSAGGTSFTATWKHV